MSVGSSRLVPGTSPEEARGAEIYFFTRKFVETTMSDEALHEDVRKSDETIWGKIIDQPEDQTILLHVFYRSLDNDVLNCLDERTFQTFENAVHSDKPDQYDCVSNKKLKRFR